MKTSWKNLMRTRRRLLLIGGAVIVIGVVVVAGMEISSTPKFCSSCHNMTPYYESWEVSSHDEVSCIKCHSDPGLGSFIKTKANGMIEAAIYLSGKLPVSYQTEVSDKSCLRGGCHDLHELKQEDVAFKKGISFSHDKHLEPQWGEAGLRCTTCHGQIIETEHISIIEETCFTCHFKGNEPNKETATCTLCHSALDTIAQAKFNHQPIVQMGLDCLSCHREVIQGEGDVYRERCLSCHTDPENLEKINEDPSFLHIKHLSEHKLECFQCHRQITHGKEA